MAELVFHKCKICGCIFYAAGKSTYCSKCVPKFSWDRAKLTYCALDNADYIEAKRARDRARWHARMNNPNFREHERLRSLSRYRADRKYAANGGEK